MNDKTWQTPRTNAASEEVMFTPTEKCPGSGFGQAVDAGFARQLERELSEAKREHTLLQGKINVLEQCNTACGEIHEICQQALIPVGHVSDRVRQLLARLIAAEKCVDSARRLREAGRDKDSILYRDDFIPALIEFDANISACDQAKGTP